MRKLSIIIPAFNEEKTIARVIKRVADQNLGMWQKEIIVVDDGSTDKTEEEIKKLEIEKLIFLHHKQNYGKGTAIKTALGHVTGDAVIIQDADLEYDPKDIPKLLEALETSKSGVVYGSRELHPKRRGYPHYVLGVRILTALVNLRFGSHLTDAYTGYKLFRTDVLKSLNIKSTGFELEMELTVKLLRKNIKIKEVAINYTPRHFSEGKKIRLKDAIIGLIILFKY